MNNFDLSLANVQEMDINEMKETDGGVIGIIATFVIGAWLADSAFNYNSTVENFKKGYNSVK